ncbi:MAG: sulfatase [Candidatus Hydrogenedentes bacterium]|nr:sulfatase [Candidatus Hydrogenedentota bacterium]
MNRRSFVKCIGAALAAPSIAIAAPRKRLPNIVFIFADDLGPQQITCYGNPYYKTPNIDTLARDGMLFTDAYAACPVCSPTRANVMTGKYPARLHLTDYIPGKVREYEKLLEPKWTKYLPLEEVTIPEMLKPAGYVSGHFGKWHLNKDKNYVLGRPMDPGSQGFDDVFTTVKPKKTDDPNKDAHHVKAITDHAIAFIEANKDKPFFCYVAHNSIHAPELERADLVAAYKARKGCDGKKNHSVLGAMVETLDKNTGRLLKKLDELGIADNTIVIFFSDNGCLQGKTVRKPFRGGKAQLYEGGIREPFLVRWPGVVKPGSRCSEPVSSIDFFPTFAEIAGQKVTDPDVDGVSILPLLRQQGSFNRGDALYWHYPHYHSGGVAPSGAIRDGRYKLIEWYEESVLGLDNPVELFDVVADVGEYNDLSKQKPELAAKMLKKLQAWRKSVGAQEMPVNPNYDPKKAKNSHRGEF